MAIPRITATYSLDVPTVRKLEEIARMWETSKSEALARLINQGAQESVGTEGKRRIAALARLQKNISRTPAEVAQWQRELREMQRAWPSPPRTRKTK